MNVLKERPLLKKPLQVIRPTLSKSGFLPASWAQFWKLEASAGIGGDSECPCCSVKTSAEATVAAVLSELDAAPRYKGEQRTPPKAFLLGRKKNVFALLRTGFCESLIKHCVTLCLATGRWRTELPAIANWLVGKNYLDLAHSPPRFESTFSEFSSIFWGLFSKRIHRMNI